MPLDPGSRPGDTGAVQLPTRFMALVTRGALSEMLAPTLARLDGVDVNEGYRRLSAALRDLPLIEGLQRETWLAARERKATLDEAGLVEHLAKRLARPRKWKPARVRPDDEGAWVALSLHARRAAGIGSGEAADLLATPGGQRLLARGQVLAGQHLAAELLR